MEADFLSRLFGTEKMKANFSKGHDNENTKAYRQCSNAHADCTGAERVH
jgi:hypothetical protein